MTDLPGWLKDAALQQFFAAAQKDGGELRAVGGCVRDFLMGRTVRDVDFATTLPPERITQVAQAQGWKVVPTGIAHGTVTVILPSSRPVEVTTLRRDVETDGRHARVEYTDDFEEDASRRDFTINALYMDAQGRISDFFGGRQDIKTQQLRFIGDADRRIEEDGLRILRYFRFLAQFGWKAEPAARAACKSHLAMLDGLSGERIAQEMKKLLAAPNPSYALEQMDKMDMPEHLATGSHWEVGKLKGLLQLEAKYNIKAHPLARLAVMLTSQGRAKFPMAIAERWKLSRADQDLLRYLCEPHEAPDEKLVKQWLCKQPSRDWVIWRVLFNAARAGDPLAGPLEVARTWPVPPFPVTAKDLLKLGMTEGPEVGARMRAMEKRWMESDYTLDKKELLEG